MTHALLIVDVQPDFAEGGALAVEGGNKVAADLAKLLYNDPSRWDLIVASQDWHAAPPDTNCGHFALEGEPDFVSSWPVHCVAGTAGAYLHPAIEHLPDVTVQKGYGTQSYSAFEGVSPDGRSLLAILRSDGMTDLSVCGIATDYCVRASVLDALGTGFQVRVLRTLCAGVAPESSARALDEMKRAGAVLVG